MAATSSTVANLQAQIATLQAEVSALTAAAPAPAAATAVVFADMPQLLNSNDPINYSTKKGESIYKEGSKALNNKALTEGFGMTPCQTMVFIEALTRRATVMGWNAGTMQITFHNNAISQAIEVIDTTAKSMRSPSREAVNVSARRWRRMQKVKPSKTTQ